MYFNSSLTIWKFNPSAKSILPYRVISHTVIASSSLYPLSHDVLIWDRHQHLVCMIWQISPFIWKNILHQDFLWCKSNKLWCMICIQMNVDLSLCRTSIYFSNPISIEFTQFYSIVEGSVLFKACFICSNLHIIIRGKLMMLNCHQLLAYHLIFHPNNVVCLCEPQNNKLWK